MIIRPHRKSGQRTKDALPDDSFTTLLYDKPSFIRGVARALDFSGALTDYNFSPSPMMADEIALHADVRAVGRDMHRSIEAVAPSRRAKASRRRNESSKRARRSGRA